MGEGVAKPPEPGMQLVAMTIASGKRRQRGRWNKRVAFNRPEATQGGVKTSKFGGRCDALKGHLYNCSNPRQAAGELTRITKEIAEYTGITYGTEVKVAIEALHTPVLPMPKDPPTEIQWPRLKFGSVGLMTMWRARPCRSQTSGSYPLVYGQGLNALRAKLKSITNQLMVAATANVIGLLQNIKLVTFRLQRPKNEPQALHRPSAISIRPANTKIKIASVTFKASKTQARCWSIPKGKWKPTLDFWKGSWQARTRSWQLQLTNKFKSASSWPKRPT